MVWPIELWLGSRLCFMRSPDLRVILIFWHDRLIYLGIEMSSKVLAILSSRSLGLFKNCVIRN